MSSVRDVIALLIVLLLRAIEFLQKIPLPVKFGLDKKNYLTPSKKDDNQNHKTPILSTENLSKKPPSGIDRYKNVTSKVKTHWSPEEKQRNGLRTFFERKERSPALNRTVASSPEAFKRVGRINSARRQSLPLQTDPIALAIENLRKTPILSSFSSCSSNNSSFVSLPENCGDH